MKHNGPDPYDILHVAPTATSREVARAYRALMRSRHPDTLPPDGRAEAGQEAQDELQDIMAAYATLGNPEKRAVYDRDHPRPAPAPQRLAAAVVRIPAKPLPAASLLIGPVIREPPPGRSAGMPTPQGSYPPPGYTLIRRRH